MDLEAIKQRISEGKNKQKEEIRHAGGNVGRDVFLSELKQSLITGKPTQSSNKLKTVNEVATIKEKEHKKIPVDPNAYTNAMNNMNNVPPPQNYPPQQQYAQQPPQNYPPQQPVERDAGLFEEIERRQREWSAGGAGLVNPQQNVQGQPQQPVRKGDYLTEAVETKFNDFLDNNFAHIIQEAMKDTIVETYKRERVKEALLENKDIVKALVVETIKELQSRQKVKTNNK